MLFTLLLLSCLFLSVPVVVAICGQCCCCMMVQVAGVFARLSASLLLPLLCAIVGVVVVVARWCWGSRCVSLCVSLLQSFFLFVCLVSLLVLLCSLLCDG